MKRIRNLFFVLCMLVGAFLISGKNANAEEFNPEVIGTLSKAGDKVEVDGATGKNNRKFFKYVSSTDELMYMYTDSISEDPVIEVFNYHGEVIRTYDNMLKTDGEYVKPEGNGNSSNSEIYIKLKKGEEYYFATYLSGNSASTKYNVKLIKATRKPIITVKACDKSESKDLSIDNLSSYGLNYDKDNYVITMKNANFPYELEIENEDNYNTFSDGLVEIKVLGENTISVDYMAFINCNESTVLTGNGSLTFKTNTEGYKPVFGVYARETKAGTVFRVDGPTIKTSVDLNAYAFSGEKLVMDSGKFIYSGNAGNGVIYAIYACVNGGEIDLMDANKDNILDRYSNIYVCYFEMNGGVIRTLVNSENHFPEYNAAKLSYKSAIFGYKRVIIYDGTLVLKYLEQDFGPNMEIRSVSADNMIESNYETIVYGGNIYVIVPDSLTEALKDKEVGIHGEYDPSKVTLIISDKANIQMSSNFDINKFECSLEYDKCTYDGKEKKPVVNVDGLVEGKDYTVTYSNNVNVGTAKVTITGKGDFSGKKELNFIIEESANGSSLTNDSNTDAPKVGTTIKDKKYIYKVTKAGSKASKVGEVSVVGLNKKSLKKIKITAKVKIDGVTYKVTSIGAKAFKGNKKITKVTIGKNVKKIGSKAFYNCKKLKNVRINSKVLKKVGKKAFYRKGGKKLTIKVPKKLKKKYKKLLKKAKTNKYVVK